MSKIKSFFVNAALFCLVFAILLTAAEAVFRIALPEPPGYVTPEIYGNVNLLYQPNSRTRWHGNMGQAIEYDTPITTNSLTQFDREHEIKKPAGVYRVIVAGDSYVEALQVPLEKGFPHLLEERLNRDPEIIASGRRVEVIKLGGSGNGALREYELLVRQGFQYAPDLVLTFFTDSNDLHDDLHYFRRQTGKEVYQHVNLKPSGVSYDKIDFYKRLLIAPWSRLNRWIAFQATEWREKRRRFKNDAANWKGTLGAYALPGSPRFSDEASDWQEAYRLTLAMHLKIAQESARHGAQCAAVLNDRPQAYRPDAYKYLFKILPGLDKELDLDLPAKKLSLFLRNNGVSVLDLNDTFIAHVGRGRTGHYVYDGHWSPDGHLWTAEALTPFVKERMLRGSEKA